MVFGDSKVVINQVNKEWECSSDSMSAYHDEVRKLESNFHGLEFHHVVREHNMATDVLSTLGSKRSQVSSGIFVQGLQKPTVQPPGDEVDLATKSD